MVLTAYNIIGESPASTPVEVFVGEAGEPRPDPRPRPQPVARPGALRGRAGLRRGRGIQTPGLGTAGPAGGLLPRPGVRLTPAAVTSIGPAAGERCSCRVGSACVGASVPEGGLDLVTCAPARASAVGVAPAPAWLLGTAPLGSQHRGHGFYPFAVGGVWAALGVRVAQETKGSLGTIDLLFKDTESLQNAGSAFLISTPSF